MTSADWDGTVIDVYKRPGKYKVASLVTSYKFFFIIHFYLLVNKMVIKSGLGGRMYFMFPVNVALARTQG